MVVWRFVLQNKKTHTKKLHSLTQECVCTERVGLCITCSVSFSFLQFLFYFIFFNSYTRLYFANLWLRFFTLFSSTHVFRSYCGHLCCSIGPQNLCDSSIHPVFSGRCGRCVCVCGKETWFKEWKKKMRQQHNIIILMSTGTVMGPHYTTFSAHIIFSHVFNTIISHIKMCDGLVFVFYI